MIIIGVDFHPEFQQIALVDTDTGEFQEKRLAHREDAEKFYRRHCQRGDLSPIASSLATSAFVGTTPTDEPEQCLPGRRAVRSLQSRLSSECGPR